MIIALDVATVTGWAAGKPGQTPMWGERDFGRGRENGEVISGFRHWCIALFSELKATTVCFESPYIPGRFGSGPPMNALTLRRLLAMVVQVEAVAFELHIRCHEATVMEITKFFLGSARQGGREAKKAATVAMCRRYGWVTESDNAADALALWHYAEFITAPEIAGRRRAGAGLELALHGSLNATA